MNFQYLAFRRRRCYVRRTQCCEQVLLKAWNLRVLRCFVPNFIKILKYVFSYYGSYIHGQVTTTVHGEKRNVDYVTTVWIRRSSLTTKKYAIWHPCSPISFGAPYFTSAAFSGKDFRTYGSRQRRLLIWVTSKLEDKKSKYRSFPCLNEESNVQTGSHLCVYIAYVQAEASRFHDFYYSIYFK